MAYSDQEIGAILNTYMYLDYNQAEDGATLESIVKDLGNNPNYNGRNEYKILKAAVEEGGMGEYVIGNQSNKMSEFSNNSTNACTFTDPSGKISVVFRGTGDGEWGDNGVGMYTEGGTIQQNDAVHYFDTIAEKNGWTTEDVIDVIGHSKGGNKVQYITMTSKYNDLIDHCINYDGQGFSPEQVDAWKEQYGEDYDKYIDKIQGVFGENDYVDPLGVTIIKDDNITIVSTESATDFIGYHDITGMFSDLEHPGLVEVDERGTWGKMAQDLSKRVMALPPELRDGCCDTIMGLLERGEGSTIGIHGERPDILDVLELGAYGVPIILFTALEHGPEIIKDLTKDWSSKDWAAFLTTAIATAYLLPVIAPVIGLVAEAAGIVYLGVLVFTSAVELIMAALDLCKNLYEKVKHLLQEFGEFIKDLFEGIQEFFKGIGEFFNNFFNGGNVDHSGGGIIVSTSYLYDTAEMYRNASREMQDIKDELFKIREELNYAIKTRINVPKPLRELESQAGFLQYRFSKHEKALQNSAEKYDAAETSIINNVETAISKIGSLDFSV